MQRPPCTALLALAVLAALPRGSATSTAYGRLMPGTVRISHDRVRLVADADITTKNGTVKHSGTFSILLVGTDDEERPAPPSTIALRNGPVLTSTKFHLNDRAIHIGALFNATPAILIKPTMATAWQTDEGDFSLSVLYNFPPTEDWLPRNVDASSEAVARLDTCLTHSADSLRTHAPSCNITRSMHNVTVIITDKAIRMFRNHAVSAELSVSSLHIGASILVMFYAMYLQKNMYRTYGVITGLTLASAASTLAWLIKEDFIHMLRDVKHSEASVNDGNVSIDPITPIIIRLIVTTVICVLADIHDPTRCLEVTKRRQLMYATAQVMYIPFQQISHGNTQVTYVYLILFLVVIINLANSTIASATALIKRLSTYNGTDTGGTTPASIVHHATVFLLCIADYVAYVATSLYSGLHMFMLSQDLPTNLAYELYTAVIILHAFYVVHRVLANRSRIRARPAKDTPQDPVPPPPPYTERTASPRTRRARNTQHAPRTRAPPAPDHESRIQHTLALLNNA